MPSIDLIRNSKSFDDWLTAEEIPRRACVALATRLAVRQLARACLKTQSSGIASCQLILRPLLIAYVSGLAPVTELTDSKLDMALRRTAKSAANTLSEAGIDWAASVVSAAKVASQRGANAKKKTIQCGDVAAEIEHQFSDTKYNIEIYAIWANIRSDAAILTRGDWLETEPLFSPVIPKRHQDAIAELKRIWKSGWEFWLYWHDRVLSGEPQNWPFLIEVALQENNFWEGSDEEINAKIADIASKYGVGLVSIPPPPPDGGEGIITEAVANSPNSERIIETDDGRFDTDPVTQIDPVAFDLGLRRLENLLTDISTAVTDRGQALSAMPVAIRPLERELGRSRDAPYLIYHALLSAARRIEIMLRGEELPANDRDVEVFHQQLLSIALDILVNDPQVKKALDARIEFHLKELTEAERADMRKLGVGLAGISTQRLGDQMIEDSKTATDPDEKDAEAKKGAVYQFASRFFRMMQRNRFKVEAVSITLTGSSIIVTLYAMFT